MPQSRSTSRGTLTCLVLFAILGRELYGLGRRAAEARPGNEGIPDAPTPSEHERTRSRPASRVTRARKRMRRFAASLTLATLFFAGAAFSTRAGDAVVGGMESGTAAACDDASSDAEPTACPDGSADASADESQDTPADASHSDATGEPAEGPIETEADPENTQEPGAGEEPSKDDATTDTAEDTSEEGEADDSTGEPVAGEAAKTGSQDAASSEDPQDDAGAETAGPPVVAPQPPEPAEATAELDPEAEAFGFATVWLRRALPDPIRPAERLAAGFAGQLRAESKRAGVDWAMVLGVLRAEGDCGRVPGTRKELRSIARKLNELLKGQEEWQALLAYHGRTSFADRVLALTRYNRAVGLRPLVRGFESEKKQIADRVLSDDRLAIYSAGRGDIAADRINVRVLVLMRYLAEAYGSVRVSSLKTGHGLYARPGIVSAHIYGLAVDIAALAGTPITGNSQPGGVTEKAVRDILLLPAELRPRQVISLLGLGGPSFPLTSHHDHIHVGF
jgi:hypothetical protein